MSPTVDPIPEPQVAPAPAPSPDPANPPPLRSVHTNTFPQLLEQYASSLAVTTYQAGKLVLLRSDAGVINTHFRSFRKPMGLAWNQGRLALGTATEVREFHDMPAVGSKLDAPNSPPRHDAVFMPRSTHVTGEILIHEMAWDSAGELWFVNTRFSCLCVRGENYSFVPRWRPPFITALAPEDRCHLNGLALRDGQPRYITALGKTDTKGGWRANKKSGGIIMDLLDNTLIADGLSMPHSPRWHDGKLWVLQSGDGGLGFIDPKTGRYQSVANLPGFTRGLDFAGPYAFVGLSQVRDSAVFSGIAIAERPPSERRCGVWVVDLRSGQIAAYVQFTDALQEIFAVQVLAGKRWPDLINSNQELIAESFVLPDDALAEVDPALQKWTGSKALITDHGPL